ncbi:dihydropteroate synthase [Microbacterium sp. STN6]|uniref:dihydropteroate synthase n=1 Tax=Microbacterium sp. STN6 TaxID=2995588 RepID=UPI0022609DBF|nr:dihydropteroate synthase [Microbacterium sp. STN6]MCX7523059.1 dihydropteroate synthase [Microbacterium sp. STN6]
MGVVNVTPDSFSDGGRYAQTDAAIAHALELVAEGADIIDVGGESTRPGAVRVGAAQEQRRVLPVVRELADRGIRVSVDTMHAETARAVATSGAAILNDVSGGLADPAMAAAVIESGLPFVVMHWRGQSITMNHQAVYADAAAEVRDELFARVDTLLGQGLEPGKLILDPGLGFAKNAEHNWRVLGHLDAFVGHGFPVLVGASRKRFLGALLPADAPMAARDAPTAVVSALAARAGAWAVRVHNVAATRLALDVVEAWHAGEGGGDA